MGDGGIEVIDLEIDVDHFVLTIGFLGPRRRAITPELLERQADASTWVAHGDEVNIAIIDLPPEESAVELRHRRWVRAIEVHTPQPQ